MFGAVMYIGCNLSPALVAVGFIMKLKVTVLLLIGGVINWWIAIPIVSAIEGTRSNVSPLDMAQYYWDRYFIREVEFHKRRRTRYIGVGAMLLGGLGAIFTLAIPLWRGFTSSMRTYMVIRRHGTELLSFNVS
jgi:uncharacterized oligopeptide transporter (OPT) family protein